MRVLVDTNVLLDYYMSRMPFYSDARQIVIKCMTEIEGFVAPHTLSNLHYILHAQAKFDDAKCRMAVSDVLDVFSLVSFSKQNAYDAVNDFSIGDFEDALQIECAKTCRANYIVTRNVTDFKNSSVPAILPSDFLKTV